MFNNVNANPVTNLIRYQAPWFGSSIQQISSTNNHTVNSSNHQVMNRTFLNGNHHPNNHSNINAIAMGAIIPTNASNTLNASNTFTAPKRKVPDSANLKTSHSNDHHAVSALLGLRFQPTQEGKPLAKKIKPQENHSNNNTSNNHSNGFSLTENRSTSSSNNREMGISQTVQFSPEFQDKALLAVFLKNPKLFSKASKELRGDPVLFCKLFVYLSNKRDCAVLLDNMDAKVLNAPLFVKTTLNYFEKILTNFSSLPWCVQIAPMEFFLKVSISKALSKEPKKKLYEYLLKYLKKVDTDQLTNMTDKRINNDSGFLFRYWEMFYPGTDVTEEQLKNYDNFDPDGDFKEEIEDYIQDMHSELVELKEALERDLQIAKSS